jgi:hypothetical protein
MQPNGDPTSQFIETCDLAIKQFNKIIQNAQDSDPSSITKLIQICKGGIKLNEARKRQCDETELLEELSDDYLFVQRYKTQHPGKLMWKLCLDEGHKAKVFQRLSSTQSLKNAYSQKRL